MARVKLLKKGILKTPNEEDYTWVIEQAESGSIWWTILDGKTPLDVGVAKSVQQAKLAIEKAFKKKR